MRRVVLLALVSLAGCAFEPSGPGDPDPIDPGEPDDPLYVDAGVVPPPPPPPPTTECRVEGPNLGVVGLMVSAPGQGIYRFDSWQLDNDGDPIGFVMSGPSTVRYQVRADEARFIADTLVWTHPSTEPDAITRIDFCAVEDGD
jgi:hypothetical protein